MKRIARPDAWQSPHTACTYPAGWKVTVANETFVVTPFVADQEVYTSTPIYWEGASRIAREDGTAIGRAYVELSGYCPCRVARAGGVSLTCELSGYCPQLP